MRIAIFDYHTDHSNAIGRLFRTLIAGMSDQHEFTVFAVSFDNPDPARIKFVRIPAVRKPLFALFLSYYLIAPIVYLWYTWRNKVRFDIVHSAEVNVFNRGLIYPHFCHTAYLRHQWRHSHPSGVRRVTRWLDHRLRALVEPLTYRLARKIVVPSKGLAREIESLFGRVVAGKIHVINNAVNVGKMKPPDDFDRAGLRRQLGLAENDLISVFIALGHFERKGLPLLLDAIKRAADQRVKLIVVGGTPSTIREYEARTEALGIRQQVVFVGTQPDIRPYVWASDIFAFPSYYEISPLVAFEAAAAGLLLIVTPLYGVEDYLVDGQNGFLIERTAEAVAERIRFALDNSAISRQLGANAAAAVRGYDEAAFIENWRRFYDFYVSSRTLTLEQAKAGTT